MTGPTVVQLRAFAAVAREQSFGAAADALDVSQPAVSAAIAALEATLGCRLFERRARGAMLTHLGEQVLPGALEVLSRLEDLVGVAERSGRAHHGPLRLGIIPTVAPYILSTVLETLAGRFPALVPEITESRTPTLSASLKAGTLDLVVLALPTGDDELAEIPLYWEEFVLLVHDEHPLAGATNVATTALADLDVLLLEEGHCLRDQAIDLCRAAGARTGQAANAASLTTVSQLVAARRGVTLLPATAVPVEVRGALSTARFSGSPLPGRRIGLAHRRSSTRTTEYAEIAGALREAIAEAELPVLIERPEGSS
jgi:LysR family hydrogen peroxide-inducible transcriptional activator